MLTGGNLGELLTSHGSSTPMVTTTIARVGLRTQILESGRWAFLCPLHQFLPCDHRRVELPHLPWADSRDDTTCEVVTRPSQGSEEDRRRNTGKALSAWKDLECSIKRWVWGTAGGGWRAGVGAWSQQLISPCSRLRRAGPYCCGS